MTIEQAKAGLQPWFKAMLVEDTRREDFPAVSEQQRQLFLASTLDVLPASHGRSDMRGRLERPLVVLLAATALVLLLACLNVANLYLARGFARRKEVALRLALGASRGRVARALLVHSAIVALSGAALGVLLAPMVMRALISFLPESAAAVDLNSDINLRVLLFVTGLAMLTAILFGLAPAVQAAGAHAAGDHLHTEPIEILLDSDQLEAEEEFAVIVADQCGERTLGHTRREDVELSQRRRGSSLFPEPAYGSLVVPNRR